MSKKEELRRAFMEMAKKKGLDISWAVCKSISGQTCTITIDDLDLANVLLGFQNSAVIVYPSVGANVLVLFTDNTSTNAVIIYADKTDKVEIMGNANGSLVNISPLVTKLNNLENKVNALILFTQTHVHSGVTAGPSTSAVPVTPVTGILTPTINSDLENNKIKHGNG